MTEKSSPRFYVRFSSFNRLENKTDNETIEGHQQKGQGHNNLVNTSEENDRKDQVNSVVKNNPDVAKDLKNKSNKKKVPVYYPTKSYRKTTNSQVKPQTPTHILQDAIKKEPTEGIECNQADTNTELDDIDVEKKKIPVFYPVKSSTKVTNCQDKCQTSTYVPQGVIKEEPTKGFEQDTDNTNKQLDESTVHPEFVEDTDVVGVDETDINFTCTTCGRHFRFKNGLTKHQVVHENGNICKVCGLVCKTRRKFTFHMHSHSLIPYTCEICNKSFKHPKYLTVHKQSHKTELEFSCKLCTKMFRTRAALKKHERTTHSDHTPFICGTCGKGFKRSDGLKKHMSVHDRSTAYSCKYCSKVFSWKNSLTEHMRMHEGRNLHKCEQCGNYFLRLKLLQEHMFSHTGATPNQCEICDKKFRRAWNLKLHMRYHTNERDYDCEICGNSFVSSSSLKGHMSVHYPELRPKRRAVEKRHHCDECGKSFEKPYRLRLHERLHTGERPFSCLHCGKSYTNTNHLKRHMEKSHGTEKVKTDILSRDPAQE